MFQLSRSGKKWTYAVIHDFCSLNNCADGSLPFAGVTADANGNLFGAASSGDAYDGGVVFELAQSGGTWTETVLHDFCQQPDCADGDNPLSDLLLDPSGNLFGTTSSGGTGQCCGTLFKLVPNGVNSQYTVLYNFCSLRNCKDGARPSGPLAMDSSANLFGTTSEGGGYNTGDEHGGGGTVFEFTGSALKVLYAFCAKRLCTDGREPNNGVTLDPSGNLFGVTSLGGGANSGTAFEIAP